MTPNSIKVAEKNLRDTSWIQEVQTDGEAIYFHKVVKNHCDFTRGMNPLDYELDVKPPIHDCVIVETFPDKWQENYGILAHCDFCSEMHNRTVGSSKSDCMEKRTPKGAEYKHTHYYCTRHIREFEKAWTHDKQTTKNNPSEKPPIWDSDDVGKGVSIGTVTGKIGTDILLCEDMGSVNNGTILPFDVIRTTKGFIFKKGGALSHLAIVCREFKIPCIILRDAEKLNDGDIITMDGSTGKITVGKKEK